MSRGVLPRLAFVCLLPAACLLAGCASAPAERTPNPQTKIPLDARDFRTLSAAELVELARTTKDKWQLSRLNHARSAPDEVRMVIAGRTDLPDSPRYTALDCLRPLAKPDGDPAYRKLLGRLVNDKSSTIRGMAIKQLVTADPDKAAGLLVAMLKDKNRVNGALYLLPRVKSKKLVGLFAEVLADLSDEAKRQDWAVQRGRVFDMLVDAGAEGETLVDAARLMITPDPDRHVSRDSQLRNAQLPGIPKEHLAAVVKELLKDEDLVVRRAAVRSLAHIEPDAAFPLAQSLLDDKDDYVRHEACTVFIGLVVSKRKTPKELIPLLKSDDSYVRNSAVVRLAQHRERAALKPMIELLNDEEQAKDVWEWLTRFFTAVPDKAAVKPLTARLGREQPGVSPGQLAAAIKACAKDEVAAAAKEIAKLLDSESGFIRSNAITALRVLGHDCVLDALVRAQRAAKSTHERRNIQRAIDAVTKDK